jgi:hypothetical protein
MHVPELSAACWRKGTRSEATNTCVEVAFAGQVVGLRDSKNAGGPVLAVPVSSFAVLRTSRLVSA